MIILCDGVWDLLHVGHIRHLEEARKMGKYLMVGVTMDRYVKKKGRPILPEDERLEMVKSLHCVSAATLCKSGVDAMEQWQPHVFVKGSDYVKKGLLDDEINHCKEHDIKIRFTSPNDRTTTSIIERIKNG